MAGDKSVKLFSTDDAAHHFGLDMIKYEDCARWVAGKLHPEGTFCPKCSAPVLDSQKDRYFLLKTIRCPECRRNYTALTGTLLNTSKLEVREVYLVAVLSHLGVPAKAIAAQLHLHHHTVTNWQQHFQAQRELASA